jgi:hypothetical protein
MNTLTRINWIARGGLAFMFAYHGLVPKLLWLSAGERTMIQAHGISQVELFANLAGVGEIALAFWIVLAPRSAWPIGIAAAALAGSAAGRCAGESLDAQGGVQPRFTQCRRACSVRSGVEQQVLMRSPKTPLIQTPAPVSSSSPSS